MVVKNGGRPSFVAPRLGLYPIVTLQHRSTTLSQFSDHTQQLFFLKWRSDITLPGALLGRAEAATRADGLR